MSDPENKNEECLKLFCRTIAELNTISLKQMEGLLNLAVETVKASNSNDSANGAEQFVEQLKTTAEEISRNARTKEEEIYKNIKESVSAEPAHSFCAAIEEKLIIAVENSLANQQQLNVIGNAILAQAANLLLSSTGKTDS